MQIVSAGGGRILGQVLHNHASVPRLMKAVLRTLGAAAIHGTGSAPPVPDRPDAVRVRCLISFDRESGM